MRLRNLTWDDRLLVRIEEEGDEILFTIEWLHRVEKVDTTTSQTSDMEKVVEEARAQAPDMAKKHSDKAPDNFRIMDASGAEAGTYSVSDKAYDGH